MAIKDLLVHIDNSETCPQRIEVAVKLANRFGAHLTGTYAHNLVAFPVYSGVAVPAYVMVEVEASAKTNAETAQKTFTDNVAGLQGESAWENIEGDPATVLSAQARHHDLVVVGQSDPNDVIGDINASVAERVSMEAGRPVLVVPYIGVAGDIGHRVVVAWDGSREAARATHDAMPFLVEADSVVVLAADPGDAGEADLAAVIDHLVRHGVKATSEVTSTGDIDIANVVLSRAADLGADLLVMGAYGHSRFREMILGGTTRRIFQTMTVPVLVSH